MPDAANTGDDAAEGADGVPAPRPANGPLRTLIATLIVALAFIAVGTQLFRLAQ